MKEVVEDYLQQLNKQQYDAVVYDGGPSLVIAGAGSGKTRVLTNKIMYLVNHGYDPRRILALTFTNKAAKEMRERIASLFGVEEASKLWMGTFHSMFLKILRFNTESIGFRPDLTIYDTSDTKSLLKTIIKEWELDDKKYPVNAIASAISSAKNSLLSPIDYANDESLVKRDIYKERPRVAEIYSEYSKRCKRSNAMDFDDILYYTNYLFRDNEDILRKYQDFFEYILVDEYQDTNFAQHAIIRQLSASRMRLCVVGDDAQSIYSFRGANIQNILRLNRQYPALKIFKLEQNYRSTQTILNAANSLIEKNTQQIPKHIFSENPKGERIPVIEAYSDFEESYIVANKIVEMKMLQSCSYGDFAILYRTNAQSRVFEENLRKRNIPYRIYGGLSFYQRKEVKDAICYFRMTVNPDDDEALCRIINYPARGIGDRTIAKLRMAAAKGNVSIWTVLNDLESYDAKFNSGTVKKLDSFRMLVKECIDFGTESDATALAEHIFSKSELVTSLYSDSTPENISRIENLNELLNAVQQFVKDNEEAGDTRTSMSDFLSVASLATDQDNDDDDIPKVTLMTVHAAKGLEFKNVFIVGVEDELFPSLRSTDSIQELEEERRLLYVAITRAKEHCVMTYATSRYRNGQTHPCSISRFINDIDPAFIKISGSYKRDIDRKYGGYRRLEKPANRMESIFRQSTMKPLATVKDGADIAANNSNSLQAGALHVGMRVGHSRFGNGEILKIDGVGIDTKVTIRFDNVGTKVLLTKFAQLSILS